jgi:hypothetical protein
MKIREEVNKYVHSKRKTYLLQQKYVLVKNNIVRFTKVTVAEGTFNKCICNSRNKRKSEGTLTQDNTNANRKYLSIEEEIYSTQ